MGEIVVGGVRCRVVVDHDLCMGNRVCEARLPEVFRVDDDSNLASPVPGEVDPALAEAVKEAVEDCPQDAIRLEPV